MLERPNGLCENTETLIIGWGTWNCQKKSQRHVTGRVKDEADAPKCPYGNAIGITVEIIKLENVKL